MNKNGEQLLLWMPVIHRGYQQLLQSLSHAEVLLLGEGFAEQFRVLGKEIRALDSAAAAHYLQASQPQRLVQVVQPYDLLQVLNGQALHLPDEDLLRDLVAQYQLDQYTERLQWHRTFLRWDRDWSTAALPPQPDQTISCTEYDQQLQAAAVEVAQRSSDWWRQVGALAVRAGKVILQAHNEHQPSPYSPYIDGDPRNNFSRGVAMEASTALHAEASLIGQAARTGISLQGADLHVSTFPCPACARLIVAAGFARCYYSCGYSVLAGEQVLRTGGTEVIYVTEAVAGAEDASLATANHPVTTNTTTT